MADDLQLRAEPDELSVGDFVQWDSAGGMAKGKIDSIERDGSINVPNSDFTINGDEDDPAALITVYREQMRAGKKQTFRFIVSQR